MKQNRSWPAFVVRWVHYDDASGACWLHWVIHATDSIAAVALSHDQTRLVRSHHEWLFFDVRLQPKPGGES